MKWKLIKILLLVFALTSALVSAQENIPEGKSQELSEDFLRIDEKPYVYLKVDPLFYNKAVDYIEARRYEDAIELAIQQRNQFGVATPEGAEANYVIGLVLLANDFKFSAFHSFITLAAERVGTKLGEAALLKLSEIVQTSAYDQYRLEELIRGYDFPDMHSSIKSFVSYNRYIYSLRIGFTNWAERHRTNIKENSYWADLVDYWIAVGEVARGRPDQANKMFKTIADKENQHPHLKEKAQLQYARLQFEKGYFEEAYIILTNLKHLPLRERGRVQLERAWTQYYLKRYDKAMGLLKALQSPLFYSSITPERHILEMIIYKELCHYEAVETVYNRFKEDFGEALEAIRQRQELREQDEIHAMALMHKDLQMDANLINMLRQEKIKLEKIDWYEDIKADFSENFTETDKRLQLKLDFALEPYARLAANELLDAEEQIHFVDYVSNLDRLRIVRQGEERDFFTEEISYVSFERIYWPVTNEYWDDELEDYKMLISSRCGETNPIPIGDGEELPEEFGGSGRSGPDRAAEQPGGDLEEEFE